MCHMLKQVAYVQVKCGLACSSLADCANNVKHIKQQDVIMKMRTVTKFKCKVYNLRKVSQCVQCLMWYILHIAYDANPKLQQQQ